MRRWALTAVTCVTFGAVAVLGQVSVTGSRFIDVATVVVVAGTLVWSARWAPRWAFLAMSVVGLIPAVVFTELKPVSLFVIAGVIASLDRQLVRWLPRDVLVRVVCATEFAAIARLSFGSHAGVSAAFAAVVLGGYVVVVLCRVERTMRRRALWTIGGVLAFMAVASGGFAYAAWSCKADLAQAEVDARAAIGLLKSGDFVAGAARLHAAEAEFRAAKTQLHRPWAYPSALVPAVAQNRSMVTRLVDVGTEALSAAASAADQIEPATLTVQHGSIDLAAVAALQSPVDQLQRAFLQLRGQLDQPLSMWVPNRLGNRIGSLRDEAERYRGTIDRLVQAVHAMPDMLGAHGPRRYFLVFTSPAESRSLGGYMGNWGVVRADKGALTLERFGRTSELVDASPPNGVKLALPQDFVDRYGAFGVVDAGSGRLTGTAWKNLTVTPDLPTMANIARGMWEASFHDHIDGVVLLDPHSLAQMLKYAGPQRIPGYAEALTADTAADFVMRGQYLAFPSVDTAQRVDVLDVLAHQTMDALLHSSLPSPIDLLHDLGPLVQERRLAVWSAHETEQRMLDAVGLSDRFPPSTGSADFGITFNNAAPNKIDAYLQHSVTTTNRHDADLDRDVVEVQLTLTNTAPATGLPYYVGGNTSGDPTNSAVLFLSMYGTQSVVGAAQDGKALPVSTAQELSLQVASNYVVVGPGAHTTVTVTFLAPGPAPIGGWRVYVAPTAQRGNRQ